MKLKLVLPYAMLVLTTEQWAIYRA